MLQEGITPPMLYSWGYEQYEKYTDIAEIIPGVKLEGDHFNIEELVSDLKRVLERTKHGVENFCSQYAETK